MGPTNQEVSGQEKKPLPPEERVVVGTSRENLRPVCSSARLFLGLRQTVSRASEVSRLAHYSEQSTISSREITSSRLLWIRLPWSILW